jgi:hypothetical protein
VLERWVPKPLLSRVIEKTLLTATWAPFRQQIDESKAMKDLNARIQQLTKLILTSQTVDESKGDDSRPASPSKVDFDMSPYQVGGLHFFSSNCADGSCT